MMVRIVLVYIWVENTFIVRVTFIKSDTIAQKYLFNLRILTFVHFRVGLYYRKRDRLVVM